MYDAKKGGAWDVLQGGRLRVRDLKGSLDGPRLLHAICDLESLRCGFLMSIDVALAVAYGL